MGALLVALLATNAIMHGIVSVRFGFQNHNQPFFVFTLVYSALFFMALLDVPYTLWAIFFLAIVGIIGLTISFNKPVRDKTLDKAIWILDAANILCAGYLLFAT